MSEVHSPSQRAAQAGVDYGAIGGVAALAYFVMIGDAASRDTHPAGLIVNSAIAAAMVVLYVIRAPHHADRFDGAILVAVVIFAAGATFSAFPRQSFDSILGILAFASALFVARGVMARPASRRALIVAFMCLSAVLTLLTAAIWLTAYLKWWSLADWATIPPLGMNFSAEPWGHRHDLALLLAMLYPAWWVGRMSTARVAGATVVGCLGLILVVIGGSRMVWLALFGATAALVVPMVVSSTQRYWRYGYLLVGLPLAAILAAVVTGAAGPLAERAIGGASLVERAAIWGPLAEAWTHRPLVGYGLGSFPWTLQLTGYFDTHSFSPRHPDSAIVQLLAESGLLGIAALGVVVVSVARRLWRSESRAATWAVVAFGLAALAGNPSDFEFMVVAAIAWLAFAIPRRPRSDAEASRVPNPPLGVVSLALLAVVGLAFAATVSSAVVYASARASIAAGRLDAAQQPLRIAAALDPGLALYPRQLGALYLLSGEAQAAVPELRRAVGLNPLDDLAWRTLGLALSEVGDDESAQSAIDRAVAVQRSDPSNLLLALRDRIDAGDQVAARDIAAEIVQAWPAIVATAEWPELLGQEDTDRILEMALDRWTDGMPSPEPILAQTLMLQALTGASGEMPRPEESRLDHALSQAYLAVMSCDPAADSKMNAMPEEDRRQATYWALAVRLAQLRDQDPGRAARMFTIMTGDALLESGLVWTLNPLNENGARGSSADRWGYHRPTIDWPSTQWDLPALRSGFVAWHLDPLQALEVAGLHETLRHCA